MGCSTRRKVSPAANKHNEDLRRFGESKQCTMAAAHELFKKHKFFNARKFEIVKKKSTSAKEEELISQVRVARDVVKSKCTIGKAKAAKSAQTRRVIVSRNEMNGVETGHVQLTTDYSNPHMRHPGTARYGLRGVYPPKHSEGAATQRNTQSRDTNLNIDPRLFDFESPDHENKAPKKSQRKNESGIPGHASISAEGPSPMRTELELPQSMGVEEVAKEYAHNQESPRSHQTNETKNEDMYWYQAYEQDLWDDGVEAESTAKMREYGYYLRSVWDSDEVMMTIEMWLAKKYADEAMQEADTMSVPSRDGDSTMEEGT